MQIEGSVPSLKMMDEEDWFGGDNSCCFCVPMEPIGIRLMGIFWALNMLGLIF